LLRISKRIFLSLSRASRFINSVKFFALTFDLWPLGHKPIYCSRAICDSDIVIFEMITVPSGDNLNIKVGNDRFQVRAWNANLKVVLSPIRLLDFSVTLLTSEKGIRGRLAYENLSLEFHPSFLSGMLQPYP
jgi:hypothetical protein